MCGRYTLTTAEGLEERFAAQWDAAERAEVTTEPRYNIAPTQSVPVVLADPEGRRIRAMRWGFRPGWVADSARPAPINARAETLWERPLFRSALARERCLLPADGFYEWRPIGARTKQPYHIRRTDGALFAIAGLYTPGAAATCVLITTAPNALMAPIHDRMPAILTPDQEALWLDPDVGDQDVLLSCLRPYPDTLLTAYPVASLVSSPRHDGPALVAPVAALAT